jgi:hypothetical protein
MWLSPQRVRKPFWPKYKRHGQVLFLLLFAVRLFSQSNLGELRLKVIDPAGLGLQASVVMVCEANQFRHAYLTAEAGDLVARGLPFGVYRFQVIHQGFATYSATVEIRSAIPTNLRLRLSVATVQTSVVVKDSDTLVDPHRTGAINRVGSDTIEHANIALPGRSVIALVNSQPGWVLEANGVLHPRGSEYQTQYVIDGVPLTDNRSASFAPEIEANDVESMTVLTANFPAEYGRKLGGVVEISTIKNPQPGFHGKLATSGGSFGTADGYLMAQDSWAKNTLSFSSEGAITGRYLDPPVLENFTNHATTTDFAAHYERDLSSRDRLGATIRHEQAVFQVPNEHVQAAAGQRQDRGTYETMGIVFYQHIFSSNMLGDLRAMSRDDSASLSSNDLSRPIVAGQERSFREGYLKGSISAHHGMHEFKSGVELDYGSVHEQFNYIITDPSQFDPGTPATFSFAGRGLDREQAWYAQDLMRLGRWTLSAGLRWDHYQLLVDKNALSPRLGIAWYWPLVDMVFHASYDRVFQTLAFENILLSTSPAVTALNAEVLRLPVQPSNGNFYEAGLTKNFFGKFKLDVNYYQRIFHNYADDDLLLNTGIGFPIAFRRGKIYGAESKLEVPRWGRVSGYLSYSYMVGFGYTPVTGGLFLGNEATSALANTGRFPVTQDQRNTFATRFRYQLVSRAWVAFGGTYGSGLPTEFNGTPQNAIQQFGQQIANRINFDRGRIRPSLSLNASVGTDLVKNDRLAMRLQADIQNLNNRINVINFAGLFSGTGIAPPRSYAVRLDTEF